MSSVPSIVGVTVTLRRPRAEDVAGRLALGQSSEVMLMFGADPAKIPVLTQYAVQKWLDDLSTHACAWIVEHEGRLLGELRLDGIEPLDRRARLAIGFYNEAKLGQGLGRQAIRMAMRYAFDVLDLHRISLRVIAYNTRAIRCYSACGFIEEGREREAAFVGGGWHDDVIMGLLSRELVRA